MNFVCRCVHMCVELGVCEYVVWDNDLMIFFLFFMASEFFILFGFFLSKSLSEVKHVTRKHCALNILSGRSGGRWSVKPSVGRSGGQRERGQRWMLLQLFFFLFFLSRRHFCKEKHDSHIHYSTFVSRTQQVHIYAKSANFQWWSLHFFIFFAWPRWWENGW